MTSSTGWRLGWGLHDQATRSHHTGNCNVSVWRPSALTRKMTALTSDRRISEQKRAARELTTILEAAVDELSEDHRIVLMLRDVEALSTRETAECLGLSEEA